MQSSSHPHPSPDSKQPLIEASIQVFEEDYTFETLDNYREKCQGRAKLQVFLKAFTDYK